MKYSKDEVIRRSKEVHGDEYDYTITEGVNATAEKIQYRCKKHDYVHTQSFHNHLQGKGCPLCAKENRPKSRKNTFKKKFLDKIKETRIDLDKYDFDAVDFDYRDELGRMKLFCKEHGWFFIRPNHFMNGVEGCKFCNGRNRNDEELINELSNIHPNLDFSQAKYSERKDDYKVKVICPEHGEFYMNYYNLLRGQGCYKCSMKKFGIESRLTNEEIIKRGIEKYGDRYTYEKLDTKNRIGHNKRKIIVTCKEHGDFEVDIHNFIDGKSGCPCCRNSKLELKVELALEKRNINFVKEQTFDWLRYKSNLFLDFYLPEYNIAIECQGSQHFEPVDIWRWRRIS